MKISAEKTKLMANYPNDTQRMINRQINGIDKGRELKEASNIFKQLSQMIVQSSKSSQGLHKPFPLC